MRNVSRKLNDNPTDALARKREYNLYHKQTTYWKKHWGIIVDDMELFRAISENSRDIKRALHLIPIIQKLKLVEGFNAN